MPLAPGAKLGPYEILSRIGAGGMGEVFRARDPRLNRDVAIKTSLIGFSGRFQKEAQAIAALNHPNICTLYDVGPEHLVMEYIEGPTLAERIKQGPVPLDEALAMAAQIASALEAAHEKSIVHRDLKPANIKLRPDGSVKVLDFGLARSGEPSAEITNDSPTLLSMPTQAGIILGTAGYMSPEQARGQAVDKRADIWAFGVVLFEMVTGKRLFDGVTVSDSLAAILVKEPDLSIAPPKVKRLLASCLEKDPRKRLRDIGDWERLLDETASPSSVPVPKRHSAAWIAAALLGLAAAATVSWIHFREKPPTDQALRYDIPLPEGVAPELQGRRFAVSPDGRALVISATVQGKRQLWLRPMDGLQFQPLPSTENADRPFWSPDSRHIAFFAEGKLKKIAAAGGPVQSLCDVASAGTVFVTSGGSWGADDVILFSEGAGGGASLERVPAAGGAPVELPKLRGRRPVFLPDGRHFLYASALGAEQAGVYVASLDSGDNRRLLPDRSTVEFAPPHYGGRIGHILFSRANTLMALPFDPATAQAAGEVFPLAENVVANINSGSIPVSVSATGLLVYGVGVGQESSRLTWFDRQGTLLGVVGPPGLFADIALSPDDKHIAADKAEITGSSANRDLWLLDVAQGFPTRFTFDPAIEATPAFSPDGNRLAFNSNRSGRLDLYMKASNGAGSEQLILKTDQPKFIYDWSPDGRYLVYSSNDPKTLQDLWLLPMADGGPAAGISTAGAPKLWLATPYNETQGQISPGSSASPHWIAFTSDESGTSEIYVQPFTDNPAGVTGKFQMSMAGGIQPRWRRDARELYYLAPDGTLMAVDVTTTAPLFAHGVPRPLFRTRVETANLVLGFRYAPSADGKRFLVNAPVGQAAQQPLTVVVNWAAGLKK